MLMYLMAVIYLERNPIIYYTEVSGITVALTDTTALSTHELNHNCTSIESHINNW